MVINKIDQSACFVLIGAGLIFLASCGKKVENGNENSPPPSGSAEIRLSNAQIRNAGILLDTPSRMKISSGIPVSGLLDVPPQNLHSIGARVPGMVKATSMLQGAHVHKGELLCMLENPEFLSWQQQYVSARARFELLETDLARQQDLAGKNLTSQKSLQQLQAEWKMVRAEMNALRQKLQVSGFSVSEIEKGNFSSDLAIRAPEDGFITAVYVNSGQVLKEGDPLCELVNPEHIHAELVVFEKDVTRLKEGQQVEFELVADPGIKHFARVFLVNRKISKDRTVQVHAHLEEIRPEFLPNMQITAHIRSDPHLEWTVPEEAILYEGNQAMVYSEGNSAGLFRKIPVKVLLREDKRVALEFPHDSSPGKLKIVVKGAYDVKSAAEKAAEEEE